MGVKSAVNFGLPHAAGFLFPGGVPGVLLLLLAPSLSISSTPSPVAVTPASVVQGSYAVVTADVPGESGRIEVMDLSYPMYRVGGIWRGLVPVALSVGPGKKRLVVKADGRTFSAELRVERRPGEKTQKLTKLTVDDKRAMNLKEDKVEIRSVLRRTGKDAMWTGPMRNPIMGRISAVFGQKRVYGGGATWFHSGVDFAMPKGWPIVAVAPGRVSIAGMMASYGNTVVLDHGQTVHTVYMHMSKLLVKEGERVNQGQIIGLVGETGMALGPHLHFSSYISTVPVDPLEFLTRGLP